VLASALYVCNKNKNIIKKHKEKNNAGAITVINRIAIMHHYYNNTSTFDGIIHF